MSEIVPIPKLRKEIKDAAENKELAIFIGAGVSRLYNCDGWDKLATRLVKSCFNSKNKNGESLITYKEKEYLKSERNRKKVITICKNLLYEAGFKDVYHDTLKKGLRHNEAIPSDNIYDYLFKMGFGGVYLTTNADAHFSNKFENRLSYKLSQLTKNKIDRSRLYHLHGYIEDIDSLIFTVPEYLRHYNSDNKEYLRFLKEIFLKYTVLFVGYGLDELEILEFMAAKSNLDGDNKNKSRFLLFPLYKDEENILRNEKSYFDSFGIEVIAYEKDQNGYNQLIDVIKTWANEIDQTSSVLVDNYREIEDIANNFSDENLERLLHLISHDESRKFHFFKAVAESSTPSDWLEFLKRNGYFNPANSPEPIESPDNKGYFSIPHWYVLDYLDSVASENELNPKKKTSKLLKQIIKENCAYIKEQDNQKRNYRTQWVLIKIIAKLPIDEITVTHANNIALLVKSYWNNTLMSSELAKSVTQKLLMTGNKNIVVKLFKIIISEELKENSFGGEYHSLLDDHWLKELLENNLELLSSSFPLECLEVLIKHINTLYSKKSAIFGTVWIPDIEGKKNNFPDKYQVQLISIGKCLIDSINDKENAKKVIELLEKRKAPILKRLLFYAYTINFSKLQPFIWEKIKQKNPLKFIDGKREVYAFFSENGDQFNKGHIKLILEWIEKINYSDLKEKPKKEKVEAYAKKEWLSSLLSSKDESVLKLYKRYDLINPSELEHPGYSSWIESGWVSHTSPYRIEDLKGLTVEELISKTKEFKEEKNWRRNIPSKEGLADALELLVEDEPEKFINNIEAFFTLGPYYIYHLFLGVKKASSEKLIFSWHDFLDCMLNHIKTGFKWNHEEDDSYSYYHAYLKEFFSFLSNQIRDETFGVENSLIAKIDDLLIYTFTNYKIKNNADRDDVVTLSINTLPGLLMETTITYLLWVARNTKKESDIKWDDRFKKLFTEKLTSPKRDREFSATLGKFIRNILYLDSSWVWDNFDKIFPQDNELFWKDTISALLFYMNNVYDVIYKKLKDLGHYSKALNTEFYSDDIGSRVIEHVCVAYLFGLEKYQDSLLKDIINDDNSAYIKKAILFFSRKDIKDDEEKRNRISVFWAAIFNKFKDLDDNESKKIILELASLQKHFNSLTTNFEMLKVSFSRCSLDHYPFEPFEIIQKYVDKEAGLVGDLIISSIDGGFYFSYKEGILQAVIEKMYEANEKERADKICIAYLHKGIGWPREIYDKYNS